MWKVEIKNFVTKSDNQFAIFKIQKYIKYSKKNVTVMPELQTLFFILNILNMLKNIFILLYTNVGVLNYLC